MYYKHYPTQSVTIPFLPILAQVSHNPRIHVNLPTSNRLPAIVMAKAMKASNGKHSFTCAATGSDNAGVAMINNTAEVIEHHRLYLWP